MDTSNSSPNGTAVLSPPPPEEVWKTTLNELELQMAKSTFNTHLKDALLVSCDNDHYIIAVRTPSSKEKVEFHLRDTIKRTAEAIAGRPVTLQFVAQGEEDAPLTMPSKNGVVTSNQTTSAAASNGRALHQEQPPEPPGEPWKGSRRQIGTDGYGGNLSEAERSKLLAKIAAREKTKRGDKQESPAKEKEGDEKPIKFRKIRKPANPLGSFVMPSHYAIRFWRPFLGPDAFDLLLIISSYAYEFETLEREGPSLKKLAAKLGRGDRTTLKGRAAAGVKRRNPAKRGLFDVLREHRLCDHRSEGKGRGQQQYFDHLTKIEDLPLLTPKQVATLSPEDQEEHLDWLLMHTAVDVTTWLDDGRETDIQPFPEDEGG